jgi:hypothetical protein
MPLLDHFHAPLYPQRSWESFHSRWANSIADALQEALPDRYVAEVQMHLGNQVEAVFPDDLAVEVRDQMDDARVVGVVELVSPRNKDRPESRRAFAVKCAAYLQRGIGLVVIDIVTNRTHNLHNELVDLLRLSEGFQRPDDTIYVVAYRPVRRQENNEVDAWPTRLHLDTKLPVAPLALRGGPVVALDLDASYMDARQRSRL